MDSTPKLIILSEQFRGRTFELNKEELTIGRVDQRDICIKDPTVSTMHCTLFRRDGVFYVRDNGSTNGTRVNGVPVQGDQELVNTDVLRVGGIELMYDSDDKSVTTVMQTTTNIDIKKGDGTETITRLNNKDGFRKKSSGNASQKIFIAVIVILSLLVLAMGFYVVKIAFFNQEPENCSKAPAPQAQNQQPPAPVPVQ